jgi:hypothetical protein
MRRTIEIEASLRRASKLARLTAATLLATALCSEPIALAEDHSSHGGAGHAASGGHGGWHNGFAGSGGGHGWHHGWRGGWGWGAGVGLGLGLGLAYPYYYGYPYAPPAYDYYGSSLSPAAPQYYCADPPGYYPQVTQCYSGWQTVPAGE